MANIKWIKIATDIFDNRKIKMLEAMPNGDTIIVIWFRLLSLAGTVNDSGYVYFTKDIPYTPQMLSTAFNRPITTIELALETFKKFGMIDIVDDLIYVSNWEKYQNVDGMEKVREQARLRQQRHREKKRLECNVTRNVTITDSNGTDIDIDIDKDINNISKDILLSDKKKLSDEFSYTTKNAFEKVLKQWNSLEPLGIRPIRCIGEQRGSLLRARLRQYGVDSFDEIVEQIKNSDFLQGKHDGRPWQITFDWVIKPRCYPKVLEGNYRNRANTNRSKGAINFIKIDHSPSYTGDMAEFEKQIIDN